MRLKILLTILGVAILAFVAVFYFLKPFGQGTPLSKISYTLQANPASVAADGASKSEISAAVFYSRFGKSTPVKNYRITFSTTLGTLSATSVYTDSSGYARTYLTSSQSGLAIVTGTSQDWVSKQTTVTFAASANPTVLFNDDFSGDLSKWQEVYNGYGYVRIENGALALKPQSSTSPSETHAALETAGISTWGDYNLELKMKTVNQLRQGSTPNAWEVGWVLFRYVDAQHFYYLIYKPNGVELGKFVNGQQIFLQTLTTPKLTIGNWDNIKISLKSNNIRAYINGTQVINFTDTNSPFLTGKIAAYSEDAYVLYDDVKVTSN